MNSVNDRTKQETLYINMKKKQKYQCDFEISGKMPANGGCINKNRT